jgi:hypothetical protein
MYQIERHFAMNGERYLNSSSGIIAAQAPFVSLGKGETGICNSWRLDK